MKALFGGFLRTTLAAAILYSARAEDRPSSRPATVSHAAATAALKAMPPTNNFAETAQGSGEVAAFDSKGFVLKANDSYLPRVALTNVTEKDFHALLESRTVYNSLTLFRNGTPRTGGSKEFESEIHRVWRKGQSLSEKIQTRITILDLMRVYNDSLASYRTSLGMANAAAAINQDALSAQPAVAAAASDAAARVDTAKDAHANGDVSRRVVHEAYHDLRQANGQLDNTIVRVNSSATLATSMQQNAEIYWRNCTLCADALSHYGITIPSKPSYEPIPPLSMRLEVDIARASHHESD